MHDDGVVFATLPSVAFRTPTLIAASVVALLGAGCVETVPSPFTDKDAGADADGSDGPLGEASPEASTDSSDSDVDPSLGGPCLDDLQCDDGIDCTFDRCDLTLERCRYVADDLICQDGRYCNGSEVCDLQIGCVAGEPVTCSDIDPCTIDRCDEDTKECVREPRDADGDGDPDWHCAGGGDCNDAEPLISSLASEVCVNSKDDDCDGEVDEEDCEYPQNDTCSDPLVLTSGETTIASVAGAKADYAASCIPSGSGGLRDIVAAIEVPDDIDYDLDVLVQGDLGGVYAAVATQCGDPATELACGATATGPLGTVARFIARKVPPGPLPIYLASDYEQNMTVRAELRPAQDPPGNETCGTAAELTPGEPVIADIIGVEQDLGSNCASAQGDLVYQFTTNEPHDIYVYGGSLDGLGYPVLSLRDAECAKPENELACKSSNSPVVFGRALPAGTYFVSVSATTPTSVQFRVELEDPSDAPADEDCDGAPAIEPNVTQIVTLQGHLDDLQYSCYPNAVDAVRSLTLSEASDVLLLGNLSSGDEGSVSLWKPACAPNEQLACEYTTPSPVRASLHNVLPGDYRVAIETRYGNPTRLTAFTRPATAPTYVVFADTCDEAQSIPPLGGFFQGNTANASAQYGAGCDQAGGAPEGAAEQMLRLDLTEQKRVVFDMRGSGYRTLLNVRKGPSCPGTEIVGACGVGYYTQRSFLDLRLDPGVYYVQVDGFFGETGPWFLDVFVVD